MAFDGETNYSDVITVKPTSGKKGSVLISPNPVMNRAQMVFESGLPSNANITVLDVTGKTVLQLNADVQEGLNNIEVDLSSLNQGVYIIAIEENGAKRVSKFVKQ